MINDSTSTQSTPNKPIPFGQKLKSTREELGIERKDAAQQLRLSEKIIIMMEKDRYPPDLPVTFIRGYLRAYGKLLQIPDFEIKKAIEPIKNKSYSSEYKPNLKPLPLPVTSGNYMIQLFTYLVIFTMLGLVATWWYRHPPQIATMAENNPINHQQTTPATTVAAAQAPSQPDPSVIKESLPNTTASTLLPNKSIAVSPPSVVQKHVTNQSAHQTKSFVYEDDEVDNDKDEE